MATKSTLKVIGLGYPRTGTMSLKHALEMLGFGPCYHMIEVLHQPSDAEFWLDAWQRYQAEGIDARIDWDFIFQGFQSTTDCPASGFWKQLISEFPDARFILTEREPDSWYSSFQSTVYEAMTHPEKSSSEHLTVQDMARTLILDGLLQGRFEDKDFAIQQLRDYSKQVRASLPADRLLVMKISEGWQPLCDFLQCPVPDAEFPRSNTRQEFTERLNSGRLTDLSGG